MQPEARINSVIEVLTQLYESWQSERATPMDRLLAQYFKTRRYIGSKDRGFISEMAYGVMRHGGALEWHVGTQGLSPNPKRLVLAALIFFYGQDKAAIDTLFSGEKYAPEALDTQDNQLVNGLLQTEFEQTSMPEPAKFNTADWLIARIKKRFPESYAEELTALNREAPVDLRTNTLKCQDRSDLIFALDKAGFLASPTPHSPLGVRLKKRIAAFGTDAFKQGWFEMQDEGSQITSLLVEAQPGQKVVDFCAGAGGKTLAIAAKMENKGRILALDNNARRLEELKKRLKRAGVDNTIIHPIESENDKFLKRHHKTADWVLVDAPCSGSGTWRRNPDLKWRLTPEQLTEFQQMQRNILGASQKLVKPGGTLVYVTCSLLEEENDAQITQFLMDYPEFSLVSPPKLWNSLAWKLKGDPKMIAIQLSPHQNNTDGFFAALLKRND